ncbi:MAG TPA: protein kinase, partial [Bryobacteraceae bacterium]
MDSDRWKQVDNLLQAALQRPPAERGRYLQQACAGDAELEREVRSLLASGQPGVMAETGPSATITQLVSGGESGWAGQTVSHYRIQEMLGAGGMGVVYKAFDTKLDRVVALKFLPPHVRHDHGLKRRLTEEARLASALDHPNIVVIHDIDETPGGDLFIAMAFHEGSTLRDRIGTGLPVPEALQIARQIASGLARAHEANVLHRDIKPGNIIVARDGITRIIDFGLAKSTDATATVDGTAKGTPIYMSPEQASGKPVDRRTDLWSLGAVLFEMLTGAPPFRGDSQLSVMRAIVHDEPPKLLAVRPDIPGEVNAIVVRALEKDPARRYQSAAEMVRDLSAALASLDAPARRPSGMRAAYAISALVLILLIAGGSAWFYQRSERRHWAREQAIPEIARLAGENKSVAAFVLMGKAGRYVPGDAQLAQIADGLTHVVSVRSSPPGASVEIKDYLSPGDPWLPLGTTPLENVRIPNGYLRWRISKAGTGEYLGAPGTGDIHGPFREFNFPLGLAASSPEGMVPVPATKFFTYNWAFGELGPYDLPTFYIDRFEVTNRQFQDFVDKGGYQKREYWKEKFIRDGRELSWDQAMDLMRDSSGRPGPSTWEAGHYPAGQADFPVGGVSWYEAMAYAEFAGKSLPTIAQWYLAAPSDIGRYVVQHSNFSGTAL